VLIMLNKPRILGHRPRDEVRAGPGGRGESPALTSLPLTLRALGSALSAPLLWRRHFSSVQFSHSVVSDSLWSHGLQHTRPPCPSPTLRVYSNSCPLSQWCHPAISSSIIPISSCPQSFPASGSFPMSQFLTSGGQSIGASVQHQSFQWLFGTNFLEDWPVWSPCSPRDSQESSPAPQFESVGSLVLSLLYGPTAICTWLLEKPQHWLLGTFVGKMTSLLFNMLSWFVVVFLPRS